MSFSGGWWRPVALEHKKGRCANRNDHHSHNEKTPQFR
jgi:hypothetical protein